MVKGVAVDVRRLAHVNPVSVTNNAQSPCSLHQHASRSIDAETIAGKFGDVDIHHQEKTVNMCIVIITRLIYLKTEP